MIATSFGNRLGFVSGCKVNAFFLGKTLSVKKGFFFNLVESYRLVARMWSLGTDLYLSTELADDHRILILSPVVATQCFGRADLTAQN